MGEERLYCLEGFDYVRWWKIRNFCKYTNCGGKDTCTEKDIFVY